MNDREKQDFKVVTLDLASLAKRGATSWRSYARDYAQLLKSDPTITEKLEKAAVACEDLATYIRSRFENNAK